MNQFRSLLNRLFGRGHSQPPAHVSQATEVAAPPFTVINGVALTREELDEQVARITESPKQQNPAVQLASCHTLKLIGYWAPLPCWSSGHNPNAEEEPPWPDVRRAVRAEWRLAEREQLAAYLRNGHLCNRYCGCSHCRFGCRVNYGTLGSGELTDGEWIWPEGLPHYVERHGVMLPEEFVASASARAWKVPSIDQVGAKVPYALIYIEILGGKPLDRIAERIAATSSWEWDSTCWLEWANGLPKVPEARPLPDPAVLERFCLVIQSPWTDGPDEQMEAFEESVWDKVQAQYGRYVPGVGEEQYMEWVSVKHRDTVVALVLDGLCRYKLMDRVKVVCSEPDPDDWQRDRNVTVWPTGGAAEPDCCRS
jgi:hypothetical protein